MNNRKSRPVDYAMAAADHQRKVNDIFVRKDTIAIDPLNNTNERRMPSLDDNNTRGDSTIGEMINYKDKQVSEKLDKHDKAKLKLARELGDLGDNEILPSCLRSSSGRVYSSGMMINTGNDKDNDVTKSPLNLRGIASFSLVCPQCRKKSEKS